MNMDTRPVVSVEVRASAKSFLSAFLSVLFLIPAGVSWPATVDAAVSGAEGGHGIAVPLHEDKRAGLSAALKGLPITELSADEAILHALNRLAYGPRPGEVEQVRRMGLAKWIEQQLNPNAIEDRAVEARLEQFPSLRMSTGKLLAEYPRPKQQAKQAETKEARLEQRQSDAAVAKIARDMNRGSQGVQEQAPS